MLPEFYIPKGCASVRVSNEVKVSKRLFVEYAVCPRKTYDLATVNVRVSVHIGTSYIVHVENNDRAYLKVTFATVPAPTLPAMIRAAFLENAVRDALRGKIDVRDSSNGAIPWDTINMQPAIDMACSVILTDSFFRLR